VNVSVVLIIFVVFNSQCSSRVNHDFVTIAKVLNIFLFVTTSYRYPSFQCKMFVNLHLILVISLCLDLKWITQNVLARTQQFECGTSYVMCLFRDMLRSTKQQTFCKCIIFSLLTKCPLGPDKMALRAGFCLRAAVWRPLV